jgi:drug/metabolite transporter (DMT)-like permease
MPEAAAPAETTQRRRAIKGSLWVLFAVSIWVGWILSTRLGVGQATGGRLTAWDIAFLRFFVAGALLLPVVLRRGLGLDRLGLAWFAVLVGGAGALYVVVVTWALHFAPAADAAALLPGTMPMFVAILAYTIMRDRLDRGQLAGLGLTLAGVSAMMASGVLARGGTQEAGATLGHLLLLAAAFLWAGSTLAMKRGGLAPLHGTATVAVVSLALYGPLYLERFTD